MSLPQQFFVSNCEINHEKLSVLLFKKKKWKEGSRRQKISILASWISQISWIMFLILLILLQVKRPECIETLLFSLTKTVLKNVTAKCRNFSTLMARKSDLLKLKGKRFQYYNFNKDVSPLFTCVTTPPGKGEYY